DKERCCRASASCRQTLLPRSRPAKSSNVPPALLRNFLKTPLMRVRLALKLNWTKAELSSFEWLTMAMELSQKTCHSYLSIIRLANSWMLTTFSESPPLAFGVKRSHRLEVWLELNCNPVRSTRKPAPKLLVTAVNCPPWQPGTAV